MLRNSCLSCSISSRSSFFSSSSSPFFSSSCSYAGSFLVSSLFTDCWIALALSSFGVKVAGVNWLAISPHSLLNCSERGYSEGNSTKNIFARKQAIEVIKVQCKSLVLLNSIGVGGFFGSVQKAFPSLVTASSGYTCISYKMSWLNSFSKRMRAYSTQSMKFLGRFRRSLRPSLRLMIS